MILTLTPDAKLSGTDAGTRHRPLGLEDVLGSKAWRRLPEAVRQRFTHAATADEYVGVFEAVSASRLGTLVAFASRIFGTPIAPRSGSNVAATVRVAPLPNGTAWERCYCWSDGTRSQVRSVKLIDAGAHLVEKLSAHLCMPLEVFEQTGSLHFRSTGYRLELFRFRGRTLGLSLPRWLSPGVTHVEHRDLGDGWFRFTLKVEHQRFGQLFFQTGRFRAAGG